MAMKANSLSHTPALRWSPHILHGSASQTAFFASVAKEEYAHYFRWIEEGMGDSTSLPIRPHFHAEYPHDTVACAPHSLTKGNACSFVFSANRSAS